MFGVMFRASPLKLFLDYDDVMEPKFLYTQNTRLGEGKETDAFSGTP